MKISNDQKIFAALVVLLTGLFLLFFQLSSRSMVHEVSIPKASATPSKVVGAGFSISVALIDSAGKPAVPPGHYLCGYMMPENQKLPQRLPPLVPPIIDSKTLTCPGVPGALATSIWRDGKLWRQYTYTRWPE